jgi:hypothetical protein
MQFLKTVAITTAALISFVAAQGDLALTSVPNSVEAGKPSTITWEGGNSGVSSLEFRLTV